MNYAFLPQSERNLLKHEYRVHVLVVALFVVSGAVLIGTISLFPTYMYSRIEEKAELSKIAAIQKKNDESGLETMKSALSYDSVLLSYAGLTASSTAYHPIIRDIVVAKGPVSLNSIATKSVSTTTIDFVIQGVAPTRESLIAFKNRLETSIPGSVAQVPLSDLAKSKQIVFSMSFAYSI